MHPLLFLGPRGILELLLLIPAIQHEFTATLEQRLVAWLVDEEAAGRQRRRAGGAVFFADGRCHPRRSSTTRGALERRMGRS